MMVKTKVDCKNKKEQRVIQGKINKKKKHVSVEVQTIAKDILLVTSDGKRTIKHSLIHN